MCLPVDAGAVPIEVTDQPSAFFGHEARVELRHREVDTVECDGRGLQDFRIAFPYTLQIDLLHCPDGIPDRMMQTDRRETAAVQLAIEVLFKFQSFVHDFVIFSCLLFAFETIDHPLVRSPHHPADGVLETTGADVYPATGGEGSGFYPFYSRLNDGSSFFHTPILSFSKK